MRGASAAMHRLLGLCTGAVVLATLGAAALSWRLAQGPVPLPWLARQIESAVDGMEGGVQLSLGSAALAWEGFRDGVDSPLEIRLTDVALRAADGRRIAEVQGVEVTLSVGGLLRGRVQPRTVELIAPVIRLWRDAEGRLALTLSATPQTEAAGEPSVWSAPLLAALARAPGTDRTADDDWSSQLRLVRIRDGQVTLLGPANVPVVSVPHANIDLRRRLAGGLDAAMQLDVALGASTLRIPANATLPAGGTRIAFEANLPPVMPSALAAAFPALAPLAALRLPVTLGLEGGANLDLARFTLRAGITLGSGEIAVAEGSVPVHAGLLRLDASAGQADLVIDSLDLMPAPGGARTRLRGWAHGRRAAGRIDAAASVSLDQVAFADLPALWPPGVGGPGARPWVVENIPEGMASNGHVDLALSAPEDLSDVTVTHLAGGVEGTGLSVHWLRPVPPVEKVDASLRLVSPDVIDIAVRGGRQVRVGASGAPMLMKTGRVVLSGLAEHDQFADISGELAGPVAEVLAILRHPRLKLLDRKPIDLREPAGQVSGRFFIDRLPLENDVDVDDLRIRAETKITGLRLAALVAGRDLQGGVLDLDANNDGLRAQGTATIGGIPAQITYEQDFRGGPPTQVTQKATAATPAITPAQLGTIGLDTLDVMTGTAGMRAEVLLRRNGRGEVAVKGDLLRTALTVPQLSWAKPAGKPGTAEFRLLLERDRIVGIDRLAVAAEGLDVAGAIEFAGGQPRLMRVARASLGPRNRASGEIRWPVRPGGPWGVSLAGPSIDASAEFGRTGPKPEPKPDAKDPPWIADLRFEQVVMAGGTVLRNVAVQGESDGRIVRQLRLLGRTQTDGGELDLRIAPDTRGRTLAVTAEDAGSFLRALDIERSVYGGRMRVSGRYDDAAEGNPLSGAAEITDFAVRDAPALAKFLQAVSVYGLVQAFSGPDLAFAELVAPFTLKGDILELSDARTYNASLGMTARGRVDLARQVIDLQGTIVPAYVLNSLLGRIPLLGRLLSPEKGGGLFAATWTMRGPLADPDVGVNPLAAITPGFLRGIFGIFNAAPLVTPDGAVAPPARVPTTPTHGSDNR